MVYYKQGLQPQSQFVFLLSMLKPSCWAKKQVYRNAWRPLKPKTFCFFIMFLDPSLVRSGAAERARVEEIERQESRRIQCKAECALNPAEIVLVSLMESLTPFQKHPVCCTLILFVFDRFCFVDLLREQPCSNSISKHLQSNLRLCCVGLQIELAQWQTASK